MAPRFDVAHEPTRDHARCPCGTVLDAGASGWVVRSNSPALASLLTSRSFCSLRCLRAFLLESMEAIDAIDIPQARTMVTDLPEAHAEIRLIYARAVELGALGPHP